MRKPTKFGLWSAASLASGLLALSGCGGGGSSVSSPTAPTVGVNIQGASWVAFQDGSNGSWQVLSSPNQAVPVSDPEGRYAVVYVCEAGRPTVNVVHALRSELPQVVANCGSPTSGNVNVEVNLQGMSGSNKAYVGIGGAVGTISGTAVLSVPSGTHDAIGVRLTPEEVPNKLWIERNRTFNANTSYTFDFELADNTNNVRVVDVGVGTLTISGIDSSVSEVVTAQVVLQQAIIGIASSTVGGTTLTVRYPLPPDGVLSPSDRVLTVVNGNSTPFGRGGIAVRSDLPATLTYELPAPYNSPSFSVNSSGPVVFTVNNFRYSAASPVQGYLVSIAGDNQIARWRLFYSAGWLGNQTQITTPSFAGLQSWNGESWDILRGRRAQTSVVAYISSNTSQANLQNYIAGNLQLLPVGYEVRYISANSEIDIP